MSKFVSTGAMATAESAAGEAVPTDEVLRLLGEQPSPAHVPASHHFTEAQRLSPDGLGVARAGW